MTTHGMMRGHATRGCVIITLVAFAQAFSIQTGGAQVPKPHVNSPNFGEIEIIVPAENGVIHWKDVGAALGDSLHLDPDLVQKIFPTGSLNLNKGSAIFAMLGINLALGDAVSLRIVKAEDGTRALRVVCDRAAIPFLVGRQTVREAAIDLDQGWQDRRRRDLPIVLCIHGLRSHPQRFDALRRFLRQSGYTTGTATYDDNQGIRESASNLAAVTAKLFEEHPDADLALVGHSMGGLVAREWTENPALSDERIKHLVTVGSPHQGSNWASLPPLLDLLSSGSFDAGDLIDVLLHQPSSAGLRDLAPDSHFLKQLNERSRVPGVSYLAIAGDSSPLSDPEVERLKKLMRAMDRNSKTMQLLRPRIKPLLTSFDELVRGKGDGAVSVESARLSTEKLVLVQRSHINFFQEPKPGNEQQVWNEILDHL